MPRRRAHVAMIGAPIVSHVLPSLALIRQLAARGHRVLFLDDAVQTLPRLRAVYDEDPADLYPYDIGAHAARALAEAQDRPLVQLSPTFVAWDGYHTAVTAHLRKLPAPTRTGIGSGGGSPSAGRPPRTWTPTAKPELSGPWPRVRRPRRARRVAEASHPTSAVSVAPGPVVGGLTPGAEAGRFERLGPFEARQLGARHRGDEGRLERARQLDGAEPGRA